MPILQQPEPLQPTDTEDKLTRIEVDTRYSPFEIVYRGEFECRLCHSTYWREVRYEERWTEEVEVDGVIAPNGKPARYALNPTVHGYYAPNTHSCIAPA